LKLLIKRIETSERGKKDMMNNATTHSGDSKSLTPEEAKILMSKTDECKVIATKAKDVAPIGFETTRKDVTSSTVVPAPAIKEGIRPGKQGDSLRPVTAAEMNENGVTIVVDRQVGRAQKAQEIEENESQRIAREKAELEKQAQEKYEQNNTENGR